jgi:hypothetical protein
VPVTVTQASPSSSRQQAHVLAHGQAIGQGAVHLVDAAATDLEVQVFDHGGHGQAGHPVDLAFSGGTVGHEHRGNIGENRSQRVGAAGVVEVPHHHPGVGEGRRVEVEAKGVPVGAGGGLAVGQQHQHPVGPAGQALAGQAQGRFEIGATPGHPPVDEVAGHRPGAGIGRRQAVEGRLDPIGEGHHLHHILGIEVVEHSQGGGAGALQGGAGHGERGVEHHHHAAGASAGPAGDRR